MRPGQWNDIIIMAIMYQNDWILAAITNGVGCDNVLSLSRHFNFEVEA